MSGPFREWASYLPDKLADYPQYQRTQRGQHLAVHVRLEHWLSPMWERA